MLTNGKELHGFYLEAIDQLPEGTFNDQAKKDFEALSPELKSIDNYIAMKINQKFQKEISSLETTIKGMESEIDEMVEKMSKVGILE